VGVIGLQLVTSNVRGSKETAWHDFTIEQSGMDLIFSPASYFENGVERFIIETSTTLTIPTTTTDTYYRVYLTEAGLSVLEAPSIDQMDNSALVNPLTLLAECMVPGATLTLDDVEIRIVKVVDR
jgi:hypothetical protein